MATGGDSAKQFNVLRFIIRFLKIGAWLTVGFTVLLIVIGFISITSNWSAYGFQYSTWWNFWSGQLLALGIGLTAGLITALLVYGAAELLDLLISIQDNTHATANVLRNMYRDQLNAQNVATIAGSQDAVLRLRDVTPEGEVVEAEMPAADFRQRR
jgi:pheromone shutdown protein TraB